MSYYEIARRAADVILERAPEPPYAVLVLGSGLGDYARRMETPIVIPYEEIPGFMVSTVHGHAGRLVMGRLFGLPVAIMQGRFHYYEG